MRVFEPTFITDRLTISGQRDRVVRCTVPLSNEMSYVQINQYSKSDMFPIKYVVPQISRLGPLLYLLDKNTKKNHLEDLHNDTNVFY